MFQVVGTLVVITCITPIFASVILPIGILYYLMQRFYIPTSRQLRRLESISRSPIFSHFEESLSGAQTIRAYGVQDRFIRESQNKIEANQSCHYGIAISRRYELKIRSSIVNLYRSFKEETFSFKLVLCCR